MKPDRDTLIDLLDERHGSWLSEDERFDAEVHAEKEEIQAVLALCKGQIRYEFVASIRQHVRATKREDATYAVLDSADAALYDFLSSGRPRRGDRSYTEQRNGFLIELTTRQRNPTLERQAELILAMNRKPEKV